MPRVLHIGADEDVFYNDAQLASDATALTTGTCTFVVKTRSGTTVSGTSGTASHVSGGDYRGVIESTGTANLSEGAEYWLEITFAQSPYNDFRRIPCTAKYRDED
jgi:hypothetical protein